MSRGRPAVLPPPGWRPPPRRVHDGLVVRVFPEEGGPPTEFDFSVLPAGRDLQQALASAFATLTGPDGTQRSVSSAAKTFAIARGFLKHVTATADPPHRPGDLLPAHLAEFRLAKPRDYTRVKVLLRGVAGLTPVFTAALLAANPPRRSGQLQSYSKGEFTAIMTAARGQLRAALSRIRAARELLEQWQASEFEEGTEQWDRGYVLDHVARTGDVPRDTSGRQLPLFPKLGPPGELVSALHLTYHEMLAGAVLLAGLTGHNAAGISDLKASHHRADGDGAVGTTPVAIVAIVKARRGQRKRYMTVPLADIPDWVLSGSKSGPRDKDDLTTPFGVFKTLCELTANSRDITGSDRLLIARAVKGGNRKGRHWIFGFTGDSAVGHNGAGKVWSAFHGLRSDGSGPDGGPLVVSWVRMRLTFVQLHQRGVAHTDKVLTDQYLLRDRGNINEYRKVVASVLEEQERNARELGLARTLSDEDVDLARRDPAAAAEKLGLEVPVLQRLLDGHLNTALAGCVDETNSPHSKPGCPCNASFLLCLSCPNARAMPAHLPVQALAHHKILALRPSMPPDRWARKLGLPEAQLRHLLGKFSPARVSGALAAATPADHDLIDRLLAGGLDAR